MVDNLIGEGASYRVVSTVCIVNFLHHLSSLLWTNTSQIWVGVEVGVGFLVQYVSEKYVSGSHLLRVSLPLLCHQEVPSFKK